MVGIASPGIGSGIDVDSVVAQLMAIESRPLVRLNVRQAEVTAEISAFGALKSALSSLQSALSPLKDASTFSATMATVSDEEVFTATTSSGALPGSFNVSVNRLAQQHKMGSNEFAATDSFGGTAGDEITVSVGTQSLTVDLSTAKTLGEIRDAVNAADDLNASATILTGDGGKQTLVVTADESGYDNRVQLAYGGTIDQSTLGLTTINVDGSGQPLASLTELNSALEVDGVSVTRSGNTVDDVIEGVTLTLLDTGGGTLQVLNDTESVTSAVQNFVNSQNALRAELDRLAADGLRGDSILLSVDSQIRSVFNAPASGAGTFSFLPEVGITTNEDGDYQLDSTLLTSALESDPQSVTGLFADAAEGFATRLDAVLEGFVQTGGLIDLRVDGLNNELGYIGGQRENLEVRLAAVEQRLLAEFTALDQLVAQLQTTSNFLSQQLSSLPGISS